MLTGVLHFANRKAAEIAVRTVKECREKMRSKMRPMPASIWEKPMHRQTFKNNRFVSMEISEKYYSSYKR